MPLAIMPYRPTAQLIASYPSKHNRPTVLTQRDHTQSDDLLTSPSHLPTVAAPTRLRKSHSGTSLYRNTKHVLASLAGYVLASRSVTPSTDSDDSESEPANSNEYISSEDDEFDLGDFLPTSTRSSNLTPPARHNAHLIRSFGKHSHSQPYLTLSTKQHTDEQKEITSPVALLSPQLLCVAEAVASSIRNILRTTCQGVHSTILVVSTQHAEDYAQYLAVNTTHYNTPTFCQPLNADNINVVRNLSGTILYTDDIALLANVESNVLDCVLVFNTDSMLDKQVLRHIHRVLKLNGVFAGTSVFESTASPNTHSQDAQHTFSSDSVLSSDSVSSPTPALTLRKFRRSAEQLSFDVHTVVDLSFEGITISRQSEHEVHGRFVAIKADALESVPEYDSNTLRYNPALHIAPTPTGSPSPDHYDNSPQYDWRHALLSSRASTPALHASASYNSITATSSHSTLHEPIGVTGIALGLPNTSDPSRPVFDSSNLHRLAQGEQQITEMTASEKQRMVDQHVFNLGKAKDGSRVKKCFDTVESVLKVHSKLAGIDLVKQYNVPKHVIEALDATFQYAIAAGLEALSNAGINVMSEDDTQLVGLPAEMQATTGVIFASSFPGIDSIVQEVTKCVSAKYEQQIAELVAKVNGDAPIGDDSMLKTKAYEYDRKLLFKLLVLANAQLAELIKATGPNTQINAACAGTTQAMTLAHDWIRLGRCQRVVVISADCATSDSLSPYIASGFMALGAATIAGKIEDASAPFDCRRTGMVMGAGAVGLVVESASAMTARGHQWSGSCKARIVDTHIANSAFHACLMDKTHIAQQCTQFIDRVEREYGIERQELAQNLVYFSHETGTGVCASIELQALEAAFGADWHAIQIANTKGFTGHPMAVAFEEVMAVHALQTGQLPPIANFQQADAKLNLLESQLSRGGVTDRQFVLRFAAGFGSQLAYVLYTKA